MSAAVPPVPSEVTEPKLSEAQRLIDTFTAPSKTFTDIRRNASWWVPWIIGGIFAGAAFWLFYSKIDLEQFIRDQIANSPMQSRAYDGLSKQQQDQMVARSETITRFTPYLVPVITLVSGLVAALLLMVAFNFVHEAAVSYGRSLAIYFYGLLPGIVASLLTILTLAMASDAEGRNPRNLVATNPAYFMDLHNTSKFLYGMVESLDVISIWSVVLIGIGFKLNSAKPKLTTGTAIATVAVLYLVWRLALSALGAV